MIQKLLIANRGEIAVRIIRAARELGIETVAVYSKDDKESLHVKLADENICVKSYLDMTSIVSAAMVLECDAIHPGFGFLSENPKFAKICEDIGVKFVGPSADIIEKMGNKSKAREIMKKANVSIVPGTGDISSVEEGLTQAKKIGFPVLIKAAAGGGGKGMRIAEDENAFEKAFEMARNEARNAFGDDRVYIEKLIENPRHVEIQIIADQYGNVVHLGERDCSVQRNHQKVIEETPSMVINEEIRKALGDQAVRAAKEVGYENAGTVEFLVDKHKKFYFIEMNTRIQVEHPVTEMVTGRDLIKEQLHVASEKKLSFTQEEITFDGHAIECRINAEDPMNNFAPSPGKVDLVLTPGGRNTRFDTYIYNGYTISPRYDSMIGKLIVHGKNREEAIAIMKRALGELTIQGIKHNVHFLYDILENQSFIESTYDTSFIEKFLSKVEA